MARSGTLHSSAALGAEQVLARGAAALGVAITARQCRQILTHLSLLERWNKAFNLSAVKDYDEMVHRHALDSLTALPHLVDGALLDIGTGAGFPGMVLAVMQPQRQCILLDSVGKKTRFCRQVAGELRLSNVTVVRSRVEHFKAPVPLGNIVARAFAALPVLAAYAADLLGPEGRVVALKGPQVASELAAIADEKWIARTHEVQTLGVQALGIQALGVRGEHVLVTLDRV
ncbi:MAG: 16S rRNA (guanine(527)-N(7))-methyltransferase RsmG [Gammaproteobacteria bacterium]|nr:16S rRNA (guanine(527)-N(7))-methyltransferase RsmG [Gammaproteobacteria bacterium]